MSVSNQNIAAAAAALPRSASAGATSAGAILSDVDGQSGDHEFTAVAGRIWRSVERLVERLVVGFGFRADVVHGLLASVRKLTQVPDFWGRDPQYVPGECRCSQASAADLEDVRLTMHGRK